MEPITLDVICLEKVSLIQMHADVRHNDLWIKDIYIYITLYMMISPIKVNGKIRIIYF